MRSTVVETVLQTAATASGNGTSMDVSGYGTAIFHIVSSVAMSGGTTVNFEATCDDTNWVAVSAQKSGTATTATTATADGDYRADVTAFKSIRARISAYSAGTTTITGYGTNSTATFIASAGAVTIADGADVAQGTTTDASTANTVIGRLKKLLSVLPAALGSATSANSLPVVIASDQAAVAVAGNVASGAAESGNPIGTGGRAATALPTAVTNAQRVMTMLNKHGKQVVVGRLRENLVTQQTTITSSTAETTIVTADATYKLDLYGLIVTNSSATGTKVTIKDATSGTTRIVLYVPALDTRGFMLPVDSGHPQATTNANWTLTCTTSVASIDVTAMCVQEL
jgi:hypothetical protein